MTDETVTVRVADVANRMATIWPDARVFFSEDWRMQHVRELLGEGLATHCDTCTCADAPLSVDMLMTYRTQRAPVIDGWATLPDGRRIQSSAIEVEFMVPVTDA